MIHALIYRGAAVALLAGAGVAPALAQSDRFVAAQPQALEVQRLELARPAELRIEAPPRAVILRADRTSDVLAARPVERRLALPEVRGDPVIKLEQGEADLRPLLLNPQAPVNVGARLRTQPALANVRADTLEVAEIPEGIVVRQFLAYDIALGTCTDAGRRRQLEAQGVECFERTSREARAAALADPASARYVENPRERRRALQAAERAIAAQQAEIDRDIAQLRAMLADPAQRAAIEAEIGAAEAARLDRLDDRALQAELVNAADVEIEELMFVPNLEPQRLRLRTRPDFGTVVDLSGRTPVLETSPLPPSRGPTDLRPVPQGPPTDLAAPPPLDIAEDIPLEEKLYLTGFTLGREHEWRRRVSITVKWCVLGCRRTYYLEPYAGFGYGFGLRFPLEVGGTYRYRHQNGQERAVVVPRIRPINGSAQDYARAGLPANRRFDGQELVAEAQAYAGFLYKLPAGRQGNVGFNVGVDLTDRLPDPFRYGQFTPPAPGQTTPAVERVITQVDLIGGRADFHVVGARVHPAVKFDLTSNGIAFRLRDHVTGTSSTITDGNSYPVAVNDNHVSRFSISDPVYNLAFQMTPGLVGRVFVDIAVWSRHWDWPVWFPQLRVQLPPGGANFSCHAGTTCSNEHRLRAAYWAPPARMPTGEAPSRATPTRTPVDRSDAPERLTVEPRPVERATVPPPSRVNVIRAMPVPSAPDEEEEEQREDDPQKAAPRPRR